MPQCIAQQEHSTWLSTITKCSSKQCTRHFGVICTRHQWLIQLSCLSTEFSSDVVTPYLSHCSRSVLAKAQLYRWTYTVTGRTWLVRIGDANGLDRLSPASLVQGYANIDVTRKAPSCLTESALISSVDSFEHAVASCSFTASAQHTGNAARPWEYNESLRSVIALDFETVGYDLTQHEIRTGDYFDKQCFCKALNTGWISELCSDSGLSSTRERLWVNATCGPATLPSNWTEGLKTTTYAYIPTDDWRWPECVSSIPRKVTGLTDRCAADACKLDPSGYCKITRAVDRTCFCRNISYDTCQGSCHTFETRIGYVRWLHGLCGKEEGWHGLPKDWRALAGPMPLDMIPWKWSIKPESAESTRLCASTEWKIVGLLIINSAILLVEYFCLTTGTASCLRYTSPRPWFLTGLMAAALYLCANWINAVSIQSTPGYGEFPITQLVLLWCSMPRFTWLTVLLVGPQLGRKTVASYMFAETVLQLLSAYPIVTTVNYGREHSFYSQGMARLETVPSAQYMYAGALMWVVVVIVTLVSLIQAIRGINVSTRHAEVDAMSKRPAINNPEPNIAEKLMISFNKHWGRMEDELAHRWAGETWKLEEAPSTTDDRHTYTVYGTLPVSSTNTHIIRKSTVRLYLIAITSLALLWIAQWLFWAGFIGMSMEEYVPARRSH
jgi:hypothetical protein